jgi:hypothetical protein
MIRAVVQVLDDAAWMQDCSRNASKRRGCVPTTAETMPIYCRFTSRENLKRKDGGLEDSGTRYRVGLFTSLSLVVRVKLKMLKVDVSREVAGRGKFPCGGVRR